MTKNNKKLPRANVLGTRITRIDLPGTITLFQEYLCGEGKHQVALVPVNSVMDARKRNDLRETYNLASLALPDGVPIIWASRFLKKPIPGRVAGPDLFLEFSKIAAIKGYTFFFLGSSTDTLKKLEEKLKSGNPGLKIAGSYSPPYSKTFSEKENRRIIEKINSIKPDLLWVGLGAPKQDLWISENLQYIDTKIAVGIGAAFDICSGKIRRAPLWMQKIGLEWFFRFLMEPLRLFKRYFLKAAPFFPLVLIQRLKGL